MLAHTPLVAFVAATDLEQAGDFYGSTLGLPVVGQSPIARVFDANGTQLRVTLVERLDPAPHTVLGWNVADVDRRRVAAFGGWGGSAALSRYDPGRVGCVGRPQRRPSGVVSGSFGQRPVGLPDRGVAVTRVILSGATGQVGTALQPAIEAASDMELVGVSSPTLGITLADALAAADCDVVIDFTVPEAAAEACALATSAGVSLVLGTTGLAIAAQADIDAAARKAGVRILYAPNFAVGAVLMMRMAEQAHELDARRPHRRASRQQQTRRAVRHRACHRRPHGR